PLVIRRNRIWPPEFDSEASIKSLQQQEADALAGVARELRITLYQVAAGDSDRFKGIVLDQNGPTTH
ncbi:hypothetical protein ABTO49_21220, partial [Acinetobacter baumannii]